MKLIQKERLGALFAQYPEIELVYLYGSHAIGAERSGSDFDLAVSAQTNDYAALKLDLLERLAQQGVERADIAFFQQSTPLLRFQMVRHNQLLYCRSNVSSGAVFSRCVNDYFDLEPTLRVQRAAYKERVLHG